MSLPILGKIQNMRTITRDMIVEYHQANYFGKNLIVAAGGGVNHREVCDYVSKYFSRLPPDPPIAPSNPPKP